MKILRQILHEIREDNRLLRGGRKSPLGELLELVREFRKGVSLS